METTSIRLPIRNLPEHFDRSRITIVLDEIEMALMNDGGVYAQTFADSFTIKIVSGRWGPRVAYLDGVKFHGSRSSMRL